MASSGHEPGGIPSSIVDRSTPHRKRYFCHQCDATILLSPDEAVCQTCNGGFVEELDDPVLPRQAEAVGMSAARESSARRGPSNLPRGPGRPQTFVVRFGGGSGSSGGSSAGSPFQLFMEDSGPPPAGGAANPAPRNPLEALFSHVFGGIMRPTHGNPGDYVWGPGGLDAIITQLLNSAEGSGPPPADQDKIDRLPTVKVSASQVANKLECSVCFDEFTLDEEAKALPCRHHYHQGCIVPWLEMHGTCPVCRKDLNGDDTSTQEFDASIGETLSTLDSQQRQDNPLTSDDTSTQDNDSRRPTHSRPSHEPMSQDDEVE